MTTPPERPEDPADRSAQAKPNRLRAASDAIISPSLAATNPFAAVALAVGIVALLFPALGVIPAIGVVVAVLGLVRSRRTSGEGGSGAARSAGGLVLSLIGLAMVLPPGAPLIPPGFGLF